MQASGKDREQAEPPNYYAGVREDHKTGCSWLLSCRRQGKKKDKMCPLITMQEFGRTTTQAVPGNYHAGVVMEGQRTSNAL